jgi:hypothetical protein
MSEVWLRGPLSGIPGLLQPSPTCSASCFTPPNMRSVT